MNSEASFYSIENKKSTIEENKTSKWPKSEKKKSTKDYSFYKNLGKMSTISNKIKKSTNDYDSANKKETYKNIIDFETKLEHYKVLDEQIFENNVNEAYKMKVKELEEMVYELKRSNDRLKNITNSNENSKKLHYLKYSNQILRRSLNNKIRILEGSPPSQPNNLELEVKFSKLQEEFQINNNYFRDHLNDIKVKFCKNYS